ncbi:MAG: hypothetical protein D6806_00950 [Deltaproteobacteria bacterium]|nr:MAG: hypothetical protein D6806_00950 [Deltaproteobacteria bacterium]
MSRTVFAAPTQRSRPRWEITAGLSGTAGSVRKTGMRRTSVLFVLAALAIFSCQPMLTVDDAGFEPDASVNREDGSAADEATDADTTADEPAVDEATGPDSQEQPADDQNPTECGGIEFRYDARQSGAASVLLAGTFNGWAGTLQDGAWPLSDDDADGIWTLAATLPSGRHYYKFVVDGNWIPDPANPNRVDDGYGGYNSFVDVDCGVHLKLVEHSVDPAAGTISATLRLVPDDAVLDPASLDITLDRTAVPADSMQVAGNTIDLTLTSVAAGYHDLRASASATDGRRSPTRLFKFALGVPADWRDSLLYFAMIDRFANGDPSNDAPLQGVDTRTNYQGGDFAGLRQKIEEGYFDSLGVSAIWISWPGDNTDRAMDGARPDEHHCGMDASRMATAPMKYSAYHAYWPAKLDQVEEHFGTQEELERLVDAAHAHGIRVLLDLVINHVHADSPLWTEHRDDFFNWPYEGDRHVCSQIGWEVEPETCWFTSYLPDIDYRNPAAVEYMVQLAIDWIVRSGADGFRLDAVKHVHRNFLRRLRERLRNELEDTGIAFYLVGETFTGDAALVASYLADDLIWGQFDFPSNLQMLLGFATRQIGLDEMDTQVRAAKQVYESTYPASIMSNFIGNHDIARFASLAAGDLLCGAWDVVSNIAQGWLSPPGRPSDPTAYDMLRLAMTYQMTVPGIPLIYYGDEIGMPGAGDPDNRRMMYFGTALDANEQAQLEFMQRLGSVRAGEPLLRTGSWPEPLVAEADLLVYARTGEGRAAIVVLNRGDNQRALDIDVSPLGLADGTELVDGLDRSNPSAQVAAGRFSVTVPPRTPQIWITP